MCYIIYTTKQEKVLADCKGQEQPYLAFPALLDLGGDILISYTRGRAYAVDPGAFLEMLRLDGRGGAIKEQKKIAALDGQIMQMGEWARFANGDIANYIDAQQKGQANHIRRISRIGLRTVRSSDGGKAAIIGLTVNYIICFTLAFAPLPWKPHLMLYGVAGLAACLFVAPLASLIWPNRKPVAGLV